MAIETLTINKSNWSGEMGEIKVDREASLLWVYDNRFKLVDISKSFGDDWTYGPVYHILSDDGSWTADCPLGTIDCDAKGRFYCGSESIERDDSDPFVAAAQLLFNTI